MTPARKVPVSIRLDPPVVDYFRRVGAELAQPYQTLINACLANAARRGLRPPLWTRRVSPDPHSEQQP
jgi:uncharacterized protein (DUF4415 family)